MKTTKKEMSKLILFTILILLSLHPLLVSSPQFVYAITNCSNISNSVSLENNFLNNNGTCFTIDASNLFLNGSGFTVGGNGSGTFINISYASNITVLNFNAISFKHGINLTNINSSIFIGNNLTDMNSSSFFSINSLNNNISLNNFSSGVAPIIFLYASLNNTVSSNIVYKTLANSGTGDAIFLFNSSNNTLFLNNISVNSANDDGIELNTAGIGVSSGNIIQYNKILIIGSGGHGVHLASDTSNSSNNTVSNNIINTTTGNGIFINYHFTNNTISFNTINTSGATGVGIDDRSAFDNLSFNNITTFNRDGIGISILRDNNSVTSNIITTFENRSYGIQTGALSFNNLISLNSINTSGVAANGINQRGPGNHTISSNNINTSGLSSIGIFLNTSSNNSKVIFNIINTFGPSSDAIEVNGSDNNISSNTITTRGNGAVGINVTAPSLNNTIFNNTIDTNDTNSYGIQLQNVQNHTLSQNTINTSGTNADPIFLRSSHNNTISSNNVRTTQSASNGAIYLLTSSDNLVNLNVVNVSLGIFPAIYLNGISTRNSILSNIINTSQNDNIALSLDTGPNNNTISSNTIDSNSGILIYDASNNTIISNTILSITSYGIRVVGNGLFSSINNILENNKINTTLATHGIFSDQSANNITILSNVIYTFGERGIGINITDSRNITIKRNNITTFIKTSDAIQLINSNNTNISFNILNTSGVSASGINLIRADGVESSFNKIVTNGTNISSAGIRVSSTSINTINFTSDNITTVVNSTQVCGGNIFLNNISSTRTGSNAGLIGFDNSACTANVTVSWFVNLSVINGTNNAVSGAGINITNITGQSLGFSTTDGNGQARFTLTEFLANATRTTYASPYNFTINYTGATTNITRINLSLTNSTFFVINLSSAPGVNTSTDPGTSSGSSSGGSSGTSIASRSTTTTFTVPPATTTTTSTTATSESTATTVPAVSLFVGDKGDAVSNLALIVGDFMPADQAIVLNDLLLTLQQASVSRAPIAREEFQFALPKNSLELNETIGKIKNIITSNDLPGVLATDNIIGSLETKMDQFLTFNSTADYDSNKVVFDNNEENKPGAYFYAKTGQQLFQYTSKFQEGLRSRTTASNDVNASLIDIKDRKLKLMGDEYVVNQIFVDTNGSRNNMISIELVKGGTEGILFEGEKGELTNEEKEYSIEILVISAEPKYAIIKVNGELLPKLGDGGSIITSTGVPFVIRDIVLSEGNIRKSLVRFYVGGKRVLLEDTNMTDNNFNTGGLTVNNQLINEESVRINAFFTDSSNTNVVINTIDYSLLADGKNGNIYIPEGETLKQNLRQPDAIFSDNFDMKFNGLKKQPSNNITFIPEGNNKYSLEFTSQELLHYKIPILTTQRDGSMRYGEKTGDSDRNLVFSEGANNAQYVVQKDDYIILSNINQNGALNTNAAFGVFNLATMNDWFGFTRILKYDGYNPSDRTLRFTDQALDIAENVKEVTTDANNNATLQMGGAFFNIKVNATDESIAVDIDGDGKINGNTSIISTQGGALIVLGTKNPKKPSPTATLGSINGTANISITTLGNKFDSGGGNFRTGFVFETRTGNNIGINKLSTLGISFTPSSDPKLSVALDGYGSYYTLHNDSTGLAETLIVDYPENQRVMDFRLEGTPATEDKNIITELKPLPENTTKLASEVDKLSGYNSVIVGSPCENHLSAKLLNYPEPCDSILPKDKALVKLFKHENGNLALLIAGRTGEQMKEAVSRIIKGEVLFNSTQAELIKEPREVEEASTQTEGTTTETTV